VSGFSFDVFTGETNKDERMDMVDRFQDPDGDHFILLISTQAGGVGLNLTAANKVVIFDPDWSESCRIGCADDRSGKRSPSDGSRVPHWPAAHCVSHRCALPLTPATCTGSSRKGPLKSSNTSAKVCAGSRTSLTTVHKQQRSRQLNQGTFERRIHQGYEGGRTEEEQGELFGTQNIFRFDPNGFVPGNVSLTLVSLTTSSRGSARQKTSSLKISSTRNMTRTRNPSPMTIPRWVICVDSLTSGRGGRPGQPSCAGQSGETACRREHPRSRRAGRSDRLE
jgi:hypothetical protein